MYLPGYQSVDDPEIRRKFSEAWGAEVPETPGYRLDQMMSGLHDGRVRGARPHRREPCADRAERPPRRGGAREARLPALAGHLPPRHDAKVRGRRPPRVELRREGRHVHEHRASRQPRASGRTAARRGEDGSRDRAPAREGARRPLARVPGRGVGVERARRPRARVVRRSLRPPRGERHPVARTRDRPPGNAGSSTPRRPRARPGAGSSSPSSTSARSRSPTPSTRSSSPPAGRSITTTRRR